VHLLQRLLKVVEDLFHQVFVCQLVLFLLDLVFVYSEAELLLLVALAYLGFHHRKIGHLEHLLLQVKYIKGVHDVLALGLDLRVQHFLASLLVVTCEVVVLGVVDAYFVEGQSEGLEVDFVVELLFDEFTLDFVAQVVERLAFVLLLLLHVLLVVVGLLADVAVRPQLGDVVRLVYELQEEAVLLLEHAELQQLFYLQDFGYTPAEFGHHC